MKRNRDRFLFIAVFLTILSAAAPVSASPQDVPNAPEAKAILAGGCFWCMEEAFEKVEGVSEVVSGYVGGTKENPTYEQVSSGGTGHYEAIEVHYDPNVVSYNELLEVFWHNIDPTDGAGQFCDKGSQYRAAIFYKDEYEKRLAEESKKFITESKPFEGPITTQILPASTFYAAEGYHQDYYRKNPVRYRYYKWGCGRAQRLEELWGPAEKP